MIGKREVVEKEEGREGKGSGRERERKRGRRRVIEREKDIG